MWNKEDVKYKQVMVRGCQSVDGKGEVGDGGGKRG